MGEAEPGSNAAEGSAADGDSAGSSGEGSVGGSSGGGGGEQPMDLSVGGARRRCGREVPALIPLALVRRVQRQQRQLAAAAGDPRALLYTQLLHHFHAQEMLRRQFALQAARMLQTAQEPSSAIHGGADAAMAPDAADKCAAESEARRRRRPLTGKHVRQGTGASPATLLTLRRKIEARQRRHALPAASVL
ncbi:uncharacterized protein LOC126298528 [Schistocerca gregaria]|uniref:uncharacterized protein LOC126298528 n=1 Tax=Schistocerca gregaria TaxID=7010 RepID=UPI00211EE61B|nr:uncharacterized protein LOC126298528 [Schistocerca gregaria]